MTTWVDGSDDAAFALTRRAAFAGAGALAAAGALAPAAGAQGGGVPRVGVPRAGVAAAEVVGQVLQDGLALTGHGIVTRLAGVPDGALFASDPPGPASARVTFTAEATVTTRFIQNSLIAATATGTLRFLLDPDGVDLDDPASFAGGTVLATFRARFHNVLTVIAPDQAIARITGELRQTAAPAVRLAGRRRRFGRVGRRFLLDASGPGTRTDAAVPRARFDVAGRLHALR
jgi:hypothetical protein